MVLAVFHHRRLGLKSVLKNVDLVLYDAAFLLKKKKTNPQDSEEGVVANWYKLKFKSTRP